MGAVLVVFVIVGKVENKRLGKLVGVEKVRNILVYGV